MLRCADNLSQITISFDLICVLSSIKNVRKSEAFALRRRTWKNCPNSPVLGVKVKAVMHVNRSCRSQAVTVGVWPRTAHVRRSSGCSIKPDSSIKTKLAFDFSPLFYARPLLPTPLLGLFRPLFPCPLSRLLAGEA